VNEVVEGGAGDGADGEGPETNGLAIASIIVGIFWLFGLGSLAALYLGRRSLREIAASPQESEGRTLALAGIWIGFAGLVGTGILAAFIVASAGSG
jgi:hypothetical protein